MPEDSDDELDFQELLDIADAVEHADAASIKQALPVAFVLEQYEVSVSQASQGLSAFCPFHNDVKTPAFTVFGENLERWGCWACGVNGDVLDLIQKFEPRMSFVDACDRARELIALLESSEWSGPTEGAKRNTYNESAATLVVNKAQSNDDYTLVDELIFLKRQKDGSDSNRFTVDWLVENFSVGVAEVFHEGFWRKEVIIPHYSADRELVGYKHRLPGEVTMAVSGAELKTHYYNGWRTDMLDAPVVFFEGESDTWNGQYEVGDTYRVLGVATGVMTKPFALEQFRDKDVFLAFDNDEAGVKGMERWDTALKTVNANVRIVPIPRGKDASQCAGSLRRLIQRARSIVARPDGLRITDNGYVRANTKSAEPISNFVLVPYRELIGDGAVAYEVMLKPGGEKTIIASFDLQNKSRIVSWALRHGRAWYGTDRDAQILLGMMQADGVFLDTGNMTTVAGLIDGHFVWPGGSIGPGYYKYVPPPSDTHMEETINIAPGAWKPDYIHTLRNIHKRRITDPILAWMAVAPMRSLLKEFPILAVSGPHGSGKTRTIETLLKSFAGSHTGSTLTGTTPHSILSGVSSTNAYIRDWDEYRIGARSDTKLMFDQVLRDSYTMQKSSKGGGGGNYMEIMSFPTTAPIVVSGEDMFSEGSHVERMIMLQMYRDGQSPDAFATANSWRNNGLPYAYLTWLHRSLNDGTFNDLKVHPGGPNDLAGRQRINIGILEMGWSLLQMFMEDADDSLGPPDFSMVVSELRDANGHTPVEDAIHWCLGELDATGFVKVVDGSVRVRVENFVKFVMDPRNGGMFSLPGRAPAIKKYMQMKYGAEEITLTENGLSKTYMAFPYSLIAR